MSDFYEDDEPTARVVDAFDRGQHGITGIQYPTLVYGCEHVTIAGPLSGTPTTTICGCELHPVATS